MICGMKGLAVNTERIVFLKQKVMSLFTLYLNFVYIKYIFYNRGGKYVHNDTNKKQEVNWRKTYEKVCKGADFSFPKYYLRY